MRLEKRIIKILEKYSKRVRYNGNHFVCYLKDGKNRVIVSETPSDRHYLNLIYNDFRRYGVIINELTKHKKL